MAPAATPGGTLTRASPMQTESPSGSGPVSPSGSSIVRKAKVLKGMSSPLSRLKSPPRSGLLLKEENGEPSVGPQIDALCSQLCPQGSETSTSGARVVQRPPAQSPTSHPRAPAGRVWPGKQLTIGDLLVPELGAMRQKAAALPEIGRAPQHVSVSEMSMSGAGRQQAASPPMRKSPAELLAAAKLVKRNADQKEQGSLHTPPLIDSLDTYADQTRLATWQPLPAGKAATGAIHGGPSTHQLQPASSAGPARQPQQPADDSMHGTDPMEVVAQPCCPKPDKIAPWMPELLDNLYLEHDAVRMPAAAGSIEANANLGGTAHAEVDMPLELASAADAPAEPSSATYERVAANFHWALKERILKDAVGTALGKQAPGLFVPECRPVSSQRQESVSPASLEAAPSVGILPEECDASSSLPQTPAVQPMPMQHSDASVGATQSAFVPGTPQEPLTILAMAAASAQAGV